MWICGKVNTSIGQMQHQINCHKGLNMLQLFMQKHLFNTEKFSNDNLLPHEQDNVKASKLTNKTSLPRNDYRITLKRLITMILTAL